MDTVRWKNADFNISLLKIYVPASPNFNGMTHAFLWTLVCYVLEACPGYYTNRKMEAADDDFLRLYSLLRCGFWGGHWISSTRGREDQLRNCLFCNLKYMSQVARTHIKMPGILTFASNPRAVKAKAGWSLGFTTPSA